ncbi:MAG: hypothetical protein SX243_01175 [Acidobacteriota bacterium]|nr:hypothetical protein [Acidobacteriota bacterium]
MLYPSSEVAHLGDHVRLGHSEIGVVVCSVDTNEFSEEYPRDEWLGLRHGILVKFEKLGLVLYVDPEDSLKLVRRANQGAVGDESQPEERQV